MWDVIGQDRAVAALRGGLAAGRVAHAYLLVGPPQVGKATLARNLAQALNCQGEGPPLRQAQERPCGRCTACHRIAQGLHADVQTVTVEADGGRAHKEIRIHQIREVERTVSLRPYEGRQRVVIVDPADAMNEEAQNALLKTLEEPPPSVVFVLITCRGEGLLPTVRSRCRRLELSPLSPAPVEAALRERWGAPSGEAQMLARLCQGRLGWAIAAIQDRSLLRQREEALHEIRGLPQRPLRERFAYAANLASQFNRDRPAVLATLELWLEWWRDVMLVLADCEGQAVNVHLLAELREAAAAHDLGSVARFLGAIGGAKRCLAENANPRLALEVLLLEAPAANVREEGWRTGVVSADATG
ncbi:MAG: DNA polymerase III subunit delta' [Dehalococcoidia bacterium]